MLTARSYTIEKEMLDVAIIGGGCSGLSALVVLRDYNYKYALFSGPNNGGVLNVKTVVGNWPGVKTTYGSAIIKDLFAQLQHERDKIYDLAVLSCHFEGESFTLKLSNGESVNAKTVLLATGTKERLLDVEGFETYWKSGIWSNEQFYEEDLGPFLRKVKGERVVVLGGGIDAMRKAVYSLRGGAQEVIMVIRGDKLKMDPHHIEMLQQFKGITLLNETKVKEFKGENGYLKSLLLTTPHGEVEMLTQNVVLATGRVPNSELAEGLVELDGKNAIILKEGRQASSLPGLFAAGDVTTSISYGQGAIAAGDGMKAGYDIIRYLQQGK